MTAADGNSPGDATSPSQDKSNGSPSRVNEQKEVDDEFEIVYEEEISESSPQPKPNSEAKSKEGIGIVNDMMSEFDIGILKEAEKEIDEMIKDIDLENESSEVPNSFAKVGQKDFPLFLTIKEFFYLLDSLMPESFFLRSIDSLIRSGINKFSGKKGYFKQKHSASSNRLFDNILLRENPEVTKEIEQVEISSDEEDIPVAKPKETSLLDQLSEKKADINFDAAEGAEIISEVEYEDFRDIFFPEFVKRTNKRNVKLEGPAVYWSMIRNMDTQDYGSFNYNMQIDYSNWKKKYGYFDTNDIYTHLRASNENDYIANNFIDFLFLDEIQDIPEHLLSFLRRFGNKFFYFSGDNAQNITKGVSFKFEKLAKTYNSYKRAKLTTEFHPLTVNFRSHQRILDLGNNLVYHLKMFFPQMIEFLPPEESKTSGPKPICIPLGHQQADLLKFMKNYMGVTEGKRSSVTDKMDDNSINLCFKSSQVFITRDYISKQSLLDLLPNAIVFTILEAKGMEFDDVILYNYFSDSENHAPFLMFKKCLTVEKFKNDTPMTKPQISGGIIKYTELTDPGSDKPYTRYEILMDKKAYQDQLSKLLQKTSESDVADEIKLLYVAVTRARQRLIIFDELKGMNEVTHKRSYFDSFWGDLDLIASGSIEDMGETLTGYNLNEKSKERKKWLKEGVEYMQRNLYDYAEICFAAAEVDSALRLARMCRTASNLKKDLCFIQAVSGQSEKDKSFLEEKKEVAKKQLGELAEEFQKSGWLTQASQCYSLAGDFEKCAQILETSGNYSKAGEYYIELGRMRDAYEMFKKAKDYMGMITCLRFENDPESVLYLICELEPIFSKDDLAKLKNMVKGQLRSAFSMLNSNYIQDTLEDQKKPGNFDGVLEEFKVSDQNYQNVPENSVQQLEKPHDERERNSEKNDGTDSNVTPVKKVDFDSDDEFKAVELGSNSKGSIGYMDSEIDEVEKLSEGFIKFSFEDKKIKSDTASVFEELCEEEASVFDFKDNQVISKLVAIYSTFNKVYEKIQQGLDEPNVEETGTAEKVIELGTCELLESELYDLKTILEESGAYSLRTLVEQKLSYPYLSLNTLRSHLYHFSQISENFIEGREIKPLLEKAFYASRRFTAMGFATSLMRFDKKLIMKNIIDYPQASGPALNEIMLLGYARQLICLLPEDMAEPILEIFGEVQTLTMLKLKSFKPSQREDTFFDVEAVLDDLVRAPGLKKILLIYKHFGSFPSLIRCSLLYFCINYMWIPVTYTDSCMKDVVKEFKKISPLMARMILVFSYFFEEKYEDAIEEIMKTNVTMATGSNNFENGFVMGTFLQIVYQMVEPKSKLPNINRVSKDLLNQVYTHVRLTDLYTGERMVYSEKSSNFCRGVFLSFRVSIVPPNCYPLYIFKLRNFIVHKSSPIIQIIDKNNCELITSPILVAEAGYEFFNIDASSVYGLIKSCSQLIKMTGSYTVSNSPAIFDKVMSLTEEAAKYNREKDRIRGLIKHMTNHSDYNKGAKKQLDLDLKKLTNPSKSISHSDRLLATKLMYWSYDYAIYEPKKPSSVDAPTTNYSFDRYYKHFKSKLLSSNHATQTGRIITNCMLLFNICAVHKKLHLFDLIKNKVLNNTLFNVCDSEYSFATGNTAEFLNERLALLEEIQNLSISDPCLEFFLPYLIEDLIVGYTLGSAPTKICVPVETFERRFRTNPLLINNIVMDGEYSATLTKNCFNKVDKELLDATKDFILEYKSHPLTKKILSRFVSGLKASKSSKNMDDDQEEVDEEGAKVRAVIITCSNPIPPKNNPDIALDLYNKLTAHLEKEEKQFADLTAKFKEAAKKRNIRFKTSSKAKTASLKMTHTAKEMILEMKKNPVTFKIADKLTAESHPMRAVLNKIFETLQKAEMCLSGERAVVQANQVKINDLLTLMVQTIDFEKEALDQFVQMSQSQAIPMNQLTEGLLSQANVMMDRYTAIQSSRKYFVKNAASQGDRNDTDADLTARMDKIKSMIYTSYNKSKMISKQIMQMRKRAQAESK